MRSRDRQVPHGGECLPFAAGIVHGCPAASMAPSASHAMAQAPPLTRPSSERGGSYDGQARSLRP
jgi:hypothetical protein